MQLDEFVCNLLTTRRTHDQSRDLQLVSDKFPTSRCNGKSALYTIRSIEDHNVKAWKAKFHYFSE